MEIDYVSSAQTTFQLEYKSGGFEGDDSFYFSHVEQIRQMDKIDLAKDPAPDLVIAAGQSLPSYRWQRRVREYAQRLNS